MQALKKILISLGIVIGVLLMVAGMLVALAGSSRVQTALAGVAAEQLSRALNTRVEVAEVDYSFPNSLLIRGVYMEDQWQDTLAYVDTLKAQFDMKALIKEDRLHINEVALCGTRAFAHKVPSRVREDSVMNYQFLIEAFRQEEKKPKKDLPFTIEVDDIALRRTHLEYCDWTADNINADLKINEIANGKIDVELDDMSLTAEHAGQALPIEDATAHFIKTGDTVSVPEISLRLPNTVFKAHDMSVTLPNADSITTDDIRRIALSAHIDEAHFSPSDLCLLSPKLCSFKGFFDITGELTGRVDSLHAAGLSLSFNNQRILLGDVTALGLPQLDSLYLKAECQDFFVNKGLLQDIISNAQGKPYQLPAIVARLGNMHYRGTLEGRLEKLILHGAFTSALGTITTNGEARTDAKFSELSFSGDVATTRFALGSLLQAKDLGAATLKLHVTGHVAEGHSFHANVCGNIGLVEYRGYAYNGIHVDGNMRNKVFDGKISCNDPNLTFAFNGSVNLAQKMPEYKIQLAVDHLRPGKLNLVQKYPDMDVRFHSDVQLSGHNLDDLLGHADIDSLTLINGEKQMFMKEFCLKWERNPEGSVAEDGHPLAPNRFTLVSDFITAGVAGNFAPHTVPVTLQKMAIRYLPSLFSESYKKRISEKKSNNELKLYAYFRDLDKIFNVLDLPYSLPQVSTIKGSLDEKANSFILLAGIPEITAGKQQMENITLNLNNEGDHLNLAISLLRHHGTSKAGQHMGDMKIYAAVQAENDSTYLALNWSNQDSIRNAGDLRMAVGFMQYNNKPLVGIHLLPTTITLANKDWQVSEAQITYAAADTTISIEQFRFGTDEQYITANGIVSTREQDSVRAELQDIDLDYFLSALTDIHNAIYFGGRVTGWATGYGLLKHPMFEANVQMLDAEINGKHVGDAYAEAHLNEQKNVVITAEIKEHLVPAGQTDTVYRQVASLDGLVKGKHWDLGIQVDSVDIAFVDYFTQNIITDIRGRASGNVHVFGWPGYTGVRLAAKPWNAGLTIPFTGGRYFTSDSIMMDSTSIVFHDMHLQDKDGNPLSLEGGVYHDGQWKNLSYNFRVHADHAICMDLPESMIDLYSGKVYGTGDVSVIGDTHVCAIDANARTEAGSNVIISVAGASSATESDFIEFVNHNPVVTEEQKKAETLGDVLHARGTDLNLNLNIEATPLVQARVVIDSHTGDQLKGRGEGNLRISYNTSTGASMLGNYTLLGGTFSFTFQNVIRREFEIAEGSSVSWTGVPESPILNVKALYHVTASLRDLFGSDADELFTQRSSVPVNCVLYLTDELMDPTIRFGIELPSSDETVQSQVRSIINTDDMLTREVLYLLVFNKFYTPEYLQNSEAVGISETYSLLSSTVTGQINSWLSKVTDAFALGFNFRTDGEGADASQEYEAQFEIHPVKGLLINGNVGYRYNDISNQPIFGNLDVEYMLTPNGKLRAKAYTHTVDRYSLRQANTVQGVGLVFKHDFNWPTPRTKEERAADREKRAAERAEKKEARAAKRTRQSTTEELKQSSK